MAQQITTKGYDLLQNLDDEKDVLYSFVNEYDGGTYLCDAITEIADSNIPIYSNDIWENAKEIREYIEEAVEQGLTEGVTAEKHADTHTYTTHTILDKMVFNFMARKMNEFLYENEEIENLDINAIESFFEDESEDFDNNESFDDIQSIVDDTIQAIKDGSYRLED
jgi:hypothetical protein